MRMTQRLRSLKWRTWAAIGLPLLLLVLTLHTASYLRAKVKHEHITPATPGQQPQDEHLKWNQAGHTAPAPVANITLDVGPKAIEPAAQRETACPDQGMPIASKPVVFTAVAAGGLPAFRELVGSLHRLRKDNMDVPLIVVYGFQLSPKESNEIRLWRNVNYFDAENELVVADQSVNMEEEQKRSAVSLETLLDYRLILNIIDINLQKHGSVIFVRPNVFFETDSLHVIQQDLDRHGYFLAANVKNVGPLGQATLYPDVPVMAFRLGTRMDKLFVKYPLQCIRGYQCTDTLRKHITLQQRNFTLVTYHDIGDLGIHELSAVPQAQRDKFCYVLLRDDILYSFDFAPHSRTGATGGQPAVNVVTISSSIQDSTKPAHDRVRVAIGMPTVTVSSVENVDEVAPLRLFLPSFISSVTEAEWRLFEYVIYIGYDAHDRFWDDPVTLATIDKKLRQFAIDYLSKTTSGLQGKFLRFEYIRFPYSKGWVRVTYLWNGLFVHAMHDSCSYFYQVNDDLTLDSPGWTSIFVMKLQTLQNIGVIGPNDHFHPRKVLTQAFVHRTHFDIFGRFYPLDIKDWYSDDWISEVYPKEQTIQVQDVVVSNKNDKGTRYVICRKPRYEEVLANGRTVFQNWQRHHLVGDLKNVGETDLADLLYQ